MVNDGGEFGLPSFFMKDFMMSDFDIFQDLLAKEQSQDGIYARFYDRDIKTEKYDENGIPVFDTVCFCEIRMKDNTAEIYDQPADDEKKARFTKEYARYELGKKQIETGNKLENFAFLSVGEIEALHYRGIFTLEALASLPEDKALSIGLEKECKLAIKFVETARVGGNAIENSKKDDEIAALKTELDQLKADKTIWESKAAELEKLLANNDELVTELEQLKAEKKALEIKLTELEKAPAKDPKTTVLGDDVKDVEKKSK